MTDFDKVQRHIARRPEELLPPAIIGVYFEQRKALLMQRVPLTGWKVYVNPYDAVLIDVWQHACLEVVDVPLTGEMPRRYGADWYTDDAVPAGTVRIEVP